MPKISSNVIGMARRGQLPIYSDGFIGVAISAFHEKAVNRELKFTSTFPYMSKYCG